MHYRLFNSFLYSLVLFIGFGVNAQKHFKLSYYQNLDVVRVTERRLVVNSLTDVDVEHVSSRYQFRFTRPSLAFSWYSDNQQFTNQIELSYSRHATLEHSNVNRFPNGSADSGELLRFFSSVSYDVSKKISGSSRSTDFYLGTGVVCYVHGIISDPPRNFKTSERSIGLIWSLTPRLIFFRTKRFNLEAASKVSFLDFRYRGLHIDNPNLPYEDQRLEHGTKLLFLPRAFNFRIGVSYRLN